MQRETTKVEKPRNKQTPEIYILFFLYFIYCKSHQSWYIEYI